MVSANNNRQVRIEEGNFHHMYSIADLIPCIKMLSNTNVVELTYDEILECDEPTVTPSRPFIKNYHHFTYVREGVVRCKYIKGVGDYNEETMKQGNQKGVPSTEVCGICSESGKEDEEGRGWVECDKCGQWVHCDCAGLSDSVCDDDFSFAFRCDNC